PTPLSPTTPPPAGEPMPPLPDDVRAFCEKHGLTAYLPTTFRLIREEFAPVGGIGMRVVDDSEDDFTRLVLTVPLRTNTPVVESFQRFLERWIPLTSPDAGMRIVVTWMFPRP